MKRSEAIISLSEKLQKSQNLLDGYNNRSVTLKCLCDNLATRAVDYCVKEIRMLPPFVDQYESDTSLDLIDNRWEPEDEEK
jgi:hypothetical protein